MASNINHWVPMEGLGQKTFQQCWFASYQMIYWSLGRDIGSVRTKLEGIIDVDDALAKGLVDYDFHKCATALGFDAWPGKHFNGARGFWDVGISDGAEKLHGLLKKGPLWVSRKTDSGSYHITVLKGYDDSGDGYFIFNNPFPGPNDAKEERIKASFYARKVTGATGSVQRIRQ